VPFQPFQWHEKARALDDAKDFLADQLKDGPRPAKDIFEAAEGRMDQREDSA